MPKPSFDFYTFLMFKTLGCYYCMVVAAAMVAIVGIGYTGIGGTFLFCVVKS
jgi:hypothetical protein